MHEIGIARQILHTVEGVARENGINRIDAVVVDCGELSLVIPDYLRELYPVVAKGTILEGSELIINEIPGMARCNGCGEVFNVIEHKGNCPECGSFEKEILTGREFLVKEIHIAESDQSTMNYPNSKRNL